MSKDADKKKQIPINKYSIYELKSEIDQSIVSHLEKKEFIENHTNSNLKIVVGLITLTCTAVAYFYPKPFPLNYNAILFSVIGYGIFSTIYWYLDKHYIKNTFYCGINSSYCSKLRAKKHHVIKEIRMNSEIKDRSVIYNLWFEFVTVEGGKVFKSAISQIDCTEVCDEMGYVHRDIVAKKFDDILNKEMVKIE